MFAHRVSLYNWEMDSDESVPKSNAIHAHLYGIIVHEIEHRALMHVIEHCGCFKLQFTEFFLLISEPDLTFGSGNISK